MAGLTVRPLAVEETRALRQAVLRPHLTVEQMTESEPANAFAAGAFIDGRLVAVGLIGAEGEPGAWRIRGMATAPESRGRGAGSAVLAALLEHARGKGGSRVWASVRIPARTLYERAGLVTISDEYEEPRIGPHVVMSLDLTEDVGVRLS